MIPREDARAARLTGSGTPRTDPASDAAVRIQRQTSSTCFSCQQLRKCSDDGVDVHTSSPLHTAGLEPQRGAEEGEPVETTPSCLEKDPRSLEHSYLAGVRPLSPERYRSVVRLRPSGARVHVRGAACMEKAPPPTARLPVLPPCRWILSRAGCEAGGSRGQGARRAGRLWPSHHLPGLFPQLVPVGRIAVLHLRPRGSAEGRQVKSREPWPSVGKEAHLLAPHLYPRPAGQAKGEDPAPAGAPLHGQSWNRAGRLSSLGSRMQIPANSVGVPSCLPPSRRAVEFPGSPGPGAVRGLQMLWLQWPPGHSQDFSPRVNDPLVPCP